MALSIQEVQSLAVSAFPRVLAIEGEPTSRSLLEQGLGNLGFDVKAIPDGRVAVNAVTDWIPEAVVLGPEPLDIDAISLIANLRRITDVPILMISSSRETPRKVSALNRGADDYIAKPFDLEELAACIRARLRRPRMQKRDVVSYADVFIDVTQRKASRAGTPIELSTREFDLFLTLARHPEQVFTRSQLLDLVWGTDRDVTHATVETYISYLRAKIEVEGAPNLIHTLRGIGYTMRCKH